METVTNLKGNQTIIIIAHRLETIKQADIIYEMQQGKIVAQGTYDELLENSKSFRELSQIKRD
jgi:ABC-type multidrug transport system fused ATPase/permease subunit